MDEKSILQKRGVMMKHKMGLYEEYFQSIMNGDKKIEIRLNDEKRQAIKVGDSIEFIQVPDAKQALEVEVEALQIFPTFRDLYEELSFEEMGCKGWTMEEMVEGTYEIYSKAQEEKWGGLAIKMKPMNGDE